MEREPWSEGMRSIAVMVKEVDNRSKHGRAGYEAPGLSAGKSRATADPARL